jgi:hypothetical protein
MTKRDDFDISGQALNNWRRLIIEKPEPAQQQLQIVIFNGTHLRLLFSSASILQMSPVMVLPILDIPFSRFLVMDYQQLLCIALFGCFGEAKRSGNYGFPR